MCKFFVRGKACSCGLAGVIVWFAKSKFCLKCGSCSVQVEGVLMIYCVETEQYSA